MKLKDIFKRTPPSPEALEQQKKEKDAYQTEYNRIRILEARKQGRQVARTRPSGSHGITSTLKTVGRGFGQVGDYGQQMQKNLSNMFDVDPFNITPKRKKRK